MPPNAVEAGIKDTRIHFIRETNTGAVQANPAWLRFSDTVRRVAEQPNANVYMQKGVGDFDIQNFLIGPEDHTLEIQYELQNWLTAGNDAAADGLNRAADGAFLNTHAYQSRQDLISGGALASGRRIYTIGLGGRVGSVTLSGDPSTGEPLTVTLGYVFEKIRSYVLEQPASGGVVTVVSTNVGDTTQSITIEDEGAGTSETLALNGTTPVVGVSSFANLDSISLDAECIGDVTVTHTAVEVGRILGQTSNGGYEGDLGIPPLGSGSFETALASAYEQIVGSTIQRGGADLEVNATVSTFEIVVDNSMEISPRVDSRKRRITEGERSITARANIFSEIGSHKSFVDHITVTESDLVWTLIQGSLTLTGSALTGLGGRTYESGQAVMRRDNVFTGKSLTVA